jgi:hypothetical protein
MMRIHFGAFLLECGKTLAAKAGTVGGIPGFLGMLHILGNSFATGRIVWPTKAAGFSMRCAR